jgi:mRNA-degrading endonuclease RelE of RelBE toxin-antitoxin system
LSARVFRTTPQFRKALRKLSPEQKRAAKAAFQIFKVNPFDPRLGAHRIHRLSGIMRRTVYAVEIEADLRTVFYLEGDTVISFNIGTHDIYNS